MSWQSEEKAYLFNLWVEISGCTFYAVLIGDAKGQRSLICIGVDVVLPPHRTRDPRDRRVVHVDLT